MQDVSNISLGLKKLLKYCSSVGQTDQCGIPPNDAHRITFKKPFKLTAAPVARILYTKFD